MSYVSLVLFEKGGETVYLKVLVDSSKNRKRLREERLEKHPDSHVVISAKSPNEENSWVNRRMRRLALVEQRQRDKRIARALRKALDPRVV